MVFEFGNFINTQLKSEDVIWKFIDDMLVALVYLDSVHHHYPIIRK